jgi:hypothetical protein
MAFYGACGIPVELNEPHHWGMRDAPDVICVVSAYLSAYNARAFGVRDYLAQLMFNSPPGLSDAMDLAKMLAMLEDFTCGRGKMGDLDTLIELAEDVRVSFDPGTLYARKGLAALESIVEKTFVLQKKHRL